MPDTFANFRPGPPTPSRILRPAAFGLPTGFERYEVPGGGAILIPIGPGDRITIENTEGGQPCELIAAANGAVDAGILGAIANSDAAGLKALLAPPPGAAAPRTGPAGLMGLRLGIERRGINLAQCGALRLFGPDTAAGSSETFTATRQAVLIIAAPGTGSRPVWPPAHPPRSAANVLAHPAPTGYSSC